MSVVQTMRGPVESSKLGRVLVHEHVFAMHVEYTQNYRMDFIEDEQVNAAVAKLNQLKAAGIDTIIDLTVLGLGRYIPRLAKVAARTDLNIVVATGCYTFNEVPQPLQHVGPGLMFDAPDPMPEMFTKDIAVGIGGTTVRAGELKCAIDMPGLTPGVERVMRAVAKTQLATGVPITVHTSVHNQTGLVAQRVFAEEGVDLRDVIVGHSGDSTDLDYLMKLADQGSILGMDRFGMDMILPLEARVKTIMDLVKRGYLDRITLSHDCFCWSDAVPEGAHEKLLPEHTYLHISHTVAPALLAAGLTQAQLDVIFIDNPRRHFEGAADRFAARTRPAS